MIREGKSSVLIKLFLPFVTLAFLFVSTSCWAWEGRVTRVVDGDTIVVEHHGARTRIRLYGIDTPEKKQWYGQNAKQFTSSQVLGKLASVDPIDTDRYGRTVAIVSVGDLVLNRMLVEYGYAWVYDKYCKKPFCSQWKSLERKARREKRGLWKRADVMPPWRYRALTRY